MAQAYNGYFAKSKTVIKCMDMKITRVSIYLSFNMG